MRAVETTEMAAASNADKYFLPSVTIGILIQVFESAMACQNPAGSTAKFIQHTGQTTRAWRYIPLMTHPRLEIHPTLGTF